MKALILAAIFIVLPTQAFAQNSVTEYTPAQRSALQAAIAKDSLLAFIPETWFDSKSLKWVRTDPDMAFGKSFRPYYQSADFNKDGLRDFAVLLLRRSKGSQPPGEMAVLIFNGIKGGKYRLVHTEQEPFADARFIRHSDGNLWVGLLESDDAGCFIPAGNGYIVEPCR